MLKIKLREFLVRLVFPPKCIICDEIMLIDSSIEICDNCYAALSFTTELDLKTGRDYYEEFYCLGKYEGELKETLLRFKYSEKPSYYRALGEMLAQKLLEDSNYEDLDIIISVPLSGKKKKQRGYNQAYLLGKEVGRVSVLGT